MRLKLMNNFFDRFKRLSLKGLFEAMIDSQIEIILENGLSYSGILLKVFDIVDNKNKNVYINLLDVKGMTNIIKVNDVTIITKDKM